MPQSPSSNTNSTPQLFHRVPQCSCRFAVRSGKTGLERGDGIERQTGRQQARLDLCDDASGVALLCMIATMKVFL